MPLGWPLGTFDRQQASFGPATKPPTRRGMGAECCKPDVERVSFRGSLLSPGLTPSGSVPFLGQHLAHDRSGAYALVVRSDTRRQRDANLVSPELVVEQGRVGNRK